MKSNYILIYHVGQLGDTIVTFPFITELYNKNKEDKLILLTDCHDFDKGYILSWDVLSYLGLFDDVIFYNPKFNNIFYGIKNLILLFIKLKSYKFTQIYNLVLRTSKVRAYRDSIFFKFFVGTKIYKALKYIKYPPQSHKGLLKELDPKWLQLLKIINVKVDNSVYSLNLKRIEIEKI